MNRGTWKYYAHHQLNDTNLDFPIDYKRAPLLPLLFASRAIPREYATKWLKMNENIEREKIVFNEQGLRVVRETRTRSFFPHHRRRFPSGSILYAIFVINKLFLLLFFIFLERFRVATRCWHAARLPPKVFKALSRDCQSHSRVD